MRGNQSAQQFDVNAGLAKHGSQSLRQVHSGHAGQADQNSLGGYRLTVGNCQGDRIARARLCGWRHRRLGRNHALDVPGEHTHLLIRCSQRQPLQQRLAQPVKRHRLKDNTEHDAV